MGTITVTTGQQLCAASRRWPVAPRSTVPKMMDDSRSGHEGRLRCRSRSSRRARQNTCELDMVGSRQRQRHHQQRRSKSWAVHARIDSCSRSRKLAFANNADRGGAPGADMTAGASAQQGWITGTCLNALAGAATRGHARVHVPTVWTPTTSRSSAATSGCRRDDRGRRAPALERPRPRRRSSAFDAGHSRLGWRLLDPTRLPRHVLRAADGSFVDRMPRHIGEGIEAGNHGLVPRGGNHRRPAWPPGTRTPSRFTSGTATAVVDYIHSHAGVRRCGDHDHH